MDNQSRLEYCEYMYSRIKIKLLEANENELYMFAMLGIKLCLRQGELLSLVWEQIDFDNKIMRKVHLKNDIYIDFELSDDIIKMLKDCKNLTTDKVKLFPTLKRHECFQKISELIGTTYFSGHELRAIGTILKLKQLEFNS